MFLSRKIQYLWVRYSARTLMISYLKELWKWDASRNNLLKLTCIGSGLDFFASNNKNAFLGDYQISFDNFQSTEFSIISLYRLSKLDFFSFSYQTSDTWNGIMKWKMYCSPQVPTRSGGPVKGCGTLIIKYRSASVTNNSQLQTVKVSEQWK